MTETAINTVRFFELHHYLMLDEYYHSRSERTEAVPEGSTSVKGWSEEATPEETPSDSETVTTEERDVPPSVEKIVDTIYQEYSFDAFKGEYKRLPCSDDKYQELIYLWIMLGLPVYSDGHQGGEVNSDDKPQEIFAIDGRKWCRKLIRHWTTDLYIKKDELKEFLREKNLPLPVNCFSEEPDNTANKTQKSNEEYAHLINNFCVLLPKLEERLLDIKHVRPESMLEIKEKERETEMLERQIELIRDGSVANRNESHEDRKQRLHAMYDEEVQLRGKLGAYNRTAKLEGIKRQTLQGILNRGQQTRQGILNREQQTLEEILDQERQIQQEMRDRE